MAEESHSTHRLIWKSCPWITGRGFGCVPHFFRGMAIDKSFFLLYVQTSLNIKLVSS